MDDYCWTADTLFSTINTPFPFPDPREIGKHRALPPKIIELAEIGFSSFSFAAKAGIADFIQPSLGPLQPNLDDFMNGIPLQGNFRTTQAYGIYFVYFGFRVFCFVQNQ